MGIGVDDNGHVSVSGWFSGTVDFGGGELIRADENDIYLMRVGNRSQSLTMVLLK